MTAREPQEMAEVAVETDAQKTHRTWDRVLVSAFLAGAYICIGALVRSPCRRGWTPHRGTLPILFVDAASTSAWSSSSSPDPTLRPAT